MKYEIIAVAEFTDDSPNPEIVIDTRLAELKAGKVRLIDYYEDAKISIRPIHPVAPEQIKVLKCKFHGEQPFVLTYAPDIYSCPITECPSSPYTWEEVWGDQYRVG